MDYSCRSDQPEVGFDHDARHFRIMEVVYPPAYQQPAHAHDTHGISLVLEGSLEEEVGGETARAEPLSLVVKPAGVRHRDRIGPGGARLLQLSLASPSRWQENGDRGLNAWRWLKNGTGLQHMIMLARILRGRAQDGEPDDVLCDLMADLSALPASRSQPPWLGRAREALNERAASGVTVREIAAEVEVHPVSLARAFRKHYGVSAAHYRKVVRLRRAVESIAAGGLGFAAVAQDAGYADQAHLCRDMRLLAGITPAGFRRLVAAN